MSDYSLWPYKEALKIIETKRDVKNSPIVFETGYGPSGLPHIGTFGEVVRTNWVRKAYEELTGNKSKLIVFSDDMDALRKVPDNVPNQDVLFNDIGLPLSKVTNPFDTTEHSSFADHNNSKLKSFVSSMDIDFEFASSTNYYKSGIFNDGLKIMAQKHAEIVDAVRPTLRGERSEQWSPFMPIHPITGKVMMVPIDNINVETGMVTWKDPETEMVIHTPIYDGHCKIQWKADWALRWFVLGVDYEMSGKDLIDSVKLSSKICRILGGNPPINLTYELFLDSEGKKISKSKGNGLSYEQWVQIASPESLSLFMFNNPTRAKKISQEIAISTEEEYIKLNNKFYMETPEENSSNPVGKFIKEQRSIIDVTYGLILNIVSASGTVSSTEVMEYLTKYRPNIDITDDYLNYMIYSAMTYHEEYIKPTKVYRKPTDVEKKYMKKLSDLLSNYDDEHTEERYQYWVFEIGKESGLNLRDWFKSLYEVLLGQSQGPRFGVFIAGYGIENTINLINSKI